MKFQLALVLVSALLPDACGTDSKNDNASSGNLAAISSEDQAANDLYLSDSIDSAADDSVSKSTSSSSGGSSSSSSSSDSETKSDITDERLTQMVASVMKNLDADTNGSLTLEEFLVMTQKRIKERSLDAEKSKKITDKMTAEFTTHAGADKILTPEELKALLKSGAPRIGMHRKGNFPGQQEDRVRASAAELIKQFDKDADGKLNAAELEALQAAQKASCDEIRGHNRRGRGSDDSGDSSRQSGDSRSSRGDDDSDDSLHDSSGRSRSGKGSDDSSSSSDSKSKSST